MAGTKTDLVSSHLAMGLHRRLVYNLVQLPGTFFGGALSTLALSKIDWFNNLITGPHLR